MNIIKKIKEIFTSKKSDVTPLLLNIGAEIIYKSNYVNTISHVCTSVNENDSYETKLMAIKEAIEQDEKNTLKYSNIIMYVVVPEDMTLEVLPLLMSDMIKRTFRDEHKNMHFLLSGSIYDYKELFRISKDLHNSFILAVKEELYQLESIFFEDFINDDIMNRINFNDYNPEDLFSIKDDGIELLDISNIETIISKLKEMGVYSKNEFNFRDVIDIMYIIINLSGKVEIKRYKAIYEKFQGNILEWFTKHDLEYLNSSYNTFGDTIESLFAPKYKISDDYIDPNIQKEFYEDVDEVVEYRD